MKKIVQMNSFQKVYYSLYDRLLSVRFLYEAFLKVKAAKGAPGVDGQSIISFEQGLAGELRKLVGELRGKTYKPLPVKRVEIPKPGGGLRKLGIPSVRDRVVQQALLEIMNPIFDPHFHPSSYGYRPGRSCHQAISKAQMFIRDYELEWVVDMDLSKCFDTLDHEFIIQSIRKRISDGSILNLIRLFLKSGIKTAKGLEKSKLGSPQGGVISPLIANIYLDLFDQFMKSRDHRIVRYADDILVLTRSRKGALNALKVATTFLERTLKLKVNTDKTHIVHSDEGVKFLGMKIFTKYTLIQEDKVKSFKEKIKKATRRNQPVNLEKIIYDLNPVLRGWGNYYKIANCQKVFEKLMGWIRRRLRVIQLKLWKKPKKLHRRLRQLGYRSEFKKIKMCSWRNSNSPLVCMALPNSYFKKIGLFNLADLKTGLSVLREAG